MATQPLTNTQKQEWQLRSKSGRPVLCYDDPNRAKQEAARRGLRLVCVTTIEEEIYNDTGASSQ